MLINEERDSNLWKFVRFFMVLEGNRQEPVVPILIARRNQEELINI
jgi:hypothetical protein